MIIEQMSATLGLPSRFIVNMAKGASHEYKHYSIPKRQGGTRDIYHPSRRLKGLQRWLLANVIEKWPVHEAAMAYRRRSSIFDNASRHAGSRYLLGMDFANFFPSISEEDLRAYIAERPNLFAGWSSMDIDVFCRFVCRGRVLTIGAPTSPALSNAICYDLDSQLHALCIKSDVAYSRYADDLFFSTLRQGVLVGVEKEVGAIVSHLNLPRKLTLNLNKTRHSSKRGARRVTGIVLGSDGLPHIGRKLKRTIRSLIHKYDSLDDPTRTKLAGLIAYASGFDPDFLNGLINKYGLSVIRRARTGRLPGN